MHNAKFSTLHLEDYSGSTKLSKAIRFLPIAIDELSQKKIEIYKSFTIRDSNSRIIGISHGPIILSNKDANLKLMSFILYFEDKRFYKHFGIDIIGISRAFIKNITKSKIAEGGSTISQQLIKNTLLSHDRSITRKCLEIVLSVILELFYTKNEILSMYYNYIYLGSGVRGFETSSKLIYRKNIEKLNDFELCGLVGLLRQPSKSHPQKNEANFRKRQKFIYDKLVNDNVIKNIDFSNPGNSINSFNLLKHVNQRFSNIAESELLKNNIERANVSSVHLTIDSKIQKHLDEILKKHSTTHNIKHVAGIVLCNKTSEVLAESSWIKAKESEFSPSFHGNIQPGSTYKTFSLLCALENGFDLDFELASSPFKSQIYKIGNKPWTVKNYAHKYHGSLTLFEALKHSDNTVFARLSELLNPEDLNSFYSKLGLSSENEKNPSIILGSTRNGVSLLSLAAAYATIARNGIYIEPKFVKAATVNDNKNLFTLNNKKIIGLFDYKSTSLVKYALSNSGRRFGDIFVSGKTGTTKNGVLFAGYNTDVSIAIWFGLENQIPEIVSKDRLILNAVESFFNNSLGYKNNLLVI